MCAHMSVQGRKLVYLHLILYGPLGKDVCKHLEKFMPLYLKEEMCM